MSIFIYIDPSPWTKGRPRFKIVFPPKGKKHMSIFWVIWSEMTWSLYLFHWEDTEFLFNRLGSAPQWEASHRRRRVPQIWKRDFSWENPPKEMLIGTFLLPNEISTEVWFLNLNLLHDHSDFPRSIVDLLGALGCMAYPMREVLTESCSDFLMG